MNGSASRYANELESSAAHLSNEALFFSAFVLFPAARTLLENGRRVAIGGRAFDLLHLLLRSRGTVVAHEEIIRQVWPTTFVEESNLRFQIARLRKVLGEHRDLLKNVPGRGYVLAVDIVSHERGGAEGSGVSAASCATMTLHRGEQVDRIETLRAQLVSVLDELSKMSGNHQPHDLTSISGSAATGGMRQAANET